MRPCFERQHQALGVVLGTQRVIGERLAAGGRDALQRDAGVTDRRVEPDPERKVVRKALVEGDDVAAGLVDADEEDLARREPEGGQQADQAAERRSACRARTAAARATAGAAASRGGRVRVALLDRLRARADRGQRDGAARRGTRPRRRRTRGPRGARPRAPRRSARVWPCGRLTPWRGSTYGLAHEGLVLARVLVEHARRRRPASAEPRRRRSPRA